jgi:predicted nucleotidyltransferase
MGTKRRSDQRSGLLDPLLSHVQQRVLGLLFGQPERAFGTAELIRLAGGGTGATHRFLIRLERTGLVTMTRLGNQKRYQANHSSPVFAELRGLIVKTVGLAEPLRYALRSIAGKVKAAFVYGSIAKGIDVAGSDVDLLLIADGLNHADLYRLLQPAEEALSRPVNPTVFGSAEWRSKRAKKDSFATRVASQPKIMIIGSEDDLA